MAQNGSGYARRWKRWLAVYAVVAVIAYLAVYLLFFHQAGSGAAGGFHY